MPKLPSDANAERSARVRYRGTAVASGDDPAAIRS